MVLQLILVMEKKLTTSYSRLKAFSKNWNTDLMHGNIALNDMQKNLPFFPPPSTIHALLLFASYSKTWTAFSHQQCNSLYVFTYQLLV